MFTGSRLCFPLPARIPGSRLFSPRPTLVESRGSTSVMPPHCARQCAAGRIRHSKASAAQPTTTLSPPYTCVRRGSTVARGWNSTLSTCVAFQRMLRNQAELDVIPFGLKSLSASPFYFSFLFVFLILFSFSPLSISFSFRLSLHLSRHALSTHQGTTRRSPREWRR